ncbi:MAG: hypothetical protein O2897_04170, partial [bacterium]|nr:hypothetical protein [bacterium]
NKIIDRPIRPKSVCFKCNGYMERRDVIREGINMRYWGDSHPGLRLANIEIHQYVCIVCGVSNSYQFDTRIPWARRSST